MDPLWAALLGALGIALLVLGSEIGIRSLRAIDRRRDLRRSERGRIGWIVLWLLGVPIPVLLALYLLRGCT